MDNIENIENIIKQLDNNLDIILDSNNNLQKNTTNLLNIFNEESKKTTNIFNEEESKKTTNILNEEESKKTKKISTELASFMCINEIDYVNEIDVIKKIYKYVIKSNLYNQENARYFRADKILETILDSLEEDEKEKGYNYFNVQKYFMKNYL